MGIFQDAIANLTAKDRMTQADRDTLNKAAALVAEIEAVAAATVAEDGSIVLPAID